MMAAQKGILPGNGGKEDNRMSAVRRHPLITFFVLSYALAWGGVPFGSFIATDRSLLPSS